MASRSTRRDGVVRRFAVGRTPDGAAAAQCGRKRSLRRQKQWGRPCPNQPSSPRGKRPPAPACLDRPYPVCRNPPCLQCPFALEAGRWDYRPCLASLQSWLSQGGIVSFYNSAAALPASRPGVFAAMHRAASPKMAVPEVATGCRFASPKKCISQVRDHKIASDESLKMQLRVVILHDMIDIGCVWLPAKLLKLPNQGTCRSDAGPVTSSSHFWPPRWEFSFGATFTTGFAPNPRGFSQTR